MDSISDEMEQGAFYVLKDGSFYKSDDGFRSLQSPVKSQESTNTSDIYKKTDGKIRYKNRLSIKEIIFSTFNDVMSKILTPLGLVLFIILIVALSIVLGLIPLFMSSSSKSLDESITQTNQITKVLSSTITSTNTNFESTNLVTTIATTETTTITTTPEPTTITTTVETTKITTTLEPTTVTITTEPTTVTTSVEPTTITTTLEPTTVTTTTETTTITTTPEPTTVTTTTQTTTITTPLTSVATTTYQVTTIVTTTCMPELITKAKELSMLSSALANSYTCISNSPYVPSFLTVSTSYYFGYPIIQQIVCFESTLDLMCPESLVIHIYSAYYGIQNTTFTSCLGTSSEAPTVCYNTDAFKQINSTCENQNTCSIAVTSSNLGDPCYGFNKQMLVQYQCVDTDRLSLINKCERNTTLNSICPNPPTNYQSYWCDNINVATLNCSNGLVILITCGFYGIDPNLSCQSDNQGITCYSDSAFQRISTRCNKKTSCSFTSLVDFSSSGFVDACYGKKKMFLVQWQCVSTSYFTATTKTTITTTTALTTQAPTSSQSITYCSSNATNIDCSTTSKSPYQPSFLNSSLTNFGYSIFQQIVFTGGTMFITCPIGLVVHIYSAYFGIQHSTLTSIQLSSPNPLATLFYSPNSFDLINATCEYKQNCSIKKGLFDSLEPYKVPSGYEQTFVQYQCVSSQDISSINQCNNLVVPSICPSISSDTTGIQEAIWCQDQTMNITCDNNQSIEIICGFYGLDSSFSSCSNDGKSVCYFSSSLNKLKEKCSNLNSCVLDNLATTFDDPCGENLYKALYVQWTCH